MSSELCVCVCKWLVLMSLMNRRGTWSPWTPAVAISPKEQTNHPGFQIWAGFSVSLKLEDPSLRGARVRSPIMPPCAPSRGSGTFSVDPENKERQLATCTDGQAHVSSHIHTYHHLLPPTLSIPSSAPFAFLCQARLLNHPRRSFKNQCSVNHSSYMNTVESYLNPITYSIGTGIHWISTKHNWLLWLSTGLLWFSQYIIVYCDFLQ